jgi:hypothetical protein
MNGKMAYVVLAAGALLLLAGCADKNSNEACVHQVTMDLDSGNYSAVLSSPCADAMQKGGAYFGRAGFDVKDVINSFVRTGSSATSPGSNSGTSDLSVYLNTMVSTVTTSTLSDLNGSETEYGTVPPSSGSYPDAQFYISLVDSVRSLSLIKSIVDISGDGNLVTTCDENANEEPDSIDAASCALLVSSGAPASVGSVVSACTASITLVADSSVITFDASHPGSYRGLIFQIDGTGSNTSGCESPNRYKQLLYLTSSGTTTWAVVTTASGDPSCLGSDGTIWPCPIIQDGQPLDLVSTINDSLNGSISSLGSAFTGTNDVQTSLQNLKSDACPSDPCTAEDIANYLETY